MSGRTKADNSKALGGIFSLSAVGAIRFPSCARTSDTYNVFCLDAFIIRASHRRSVSQPSLVVFLLYHISKPVPASQAWARFHTPDSCLAIASAHRFLVPSANNTAYKFNLKRSKTFASPVYRCPEPSAESVRRLLAYRLHLRSLPPIIT
jgi:hypothetical protein